MSGRIRPSARKKTLHNVMRSELSETDKKCIEEVFEKFEQQKAEIENLNSRIRNTENSIILNIEKEFAEELITAIKRVILHDDDNEFLCTDDYNALDELKDTLMMKTGGYEK